MDTPQNKEPNRKTAITSLAIVGFVALIGAGIYLAIYSARFVPSAVNSIGDAAVAVAGIFRPGNTHPAPEATSTPPSGTPSATSTEATSTVPSEPPVPVKPVAPVAGTETATATPIHSAPSYYGLPDFSVQIVSVGYLATSSATSFVPSQSVPVGARPAVHFIIKNIGTNVSGSWRFSANIPTQTAYVYQSVPQQSLAPGDSIEYTLGFDGANTGNQTITIVANFDKSITESNYQNDTAAASVVILGS